MSTPYKLEWHEVDDRQCLEWLLHNPKTLVETSAEEGPVLLPAGYFLFSSILLSTLWRNSFPIPKELIFSTGLFDDKVRQTMHTKVVEILLRNGITGNALGPYQQQLLEDSAQLSALLSTEMAPWFESIDLFAICETMNLPEIREVLDSYRPGDFKDLGIGQIETLFKDYSKRVIDTFKSVKEGNCFYPFLRMNALNNGQFVQLVGSAGTRSDVNERMFTIPLINSYFTGHATQSERALDSRSTVKSKYYSKEHMAKAQYTNRQIQLMCSSVKRIYKGDCGSNVHLTFHVPKGKSKNLCGTYVLQKDGGYVIIDKQNHHLFDEKDVKIRTPIGCRHNDGFCHVCGGTMSDWLSESTNPGINATLVIISRIVQTILSSKHLVVTNSSSYVPPNKYAFFFRVHNNEVFIGKDPKYRQWSLGIPTDDVSHVTDLDYVTTPDLNDRFFSKITSVSIIETKTGKELVPPTLMVGQDKCIPYFSEEFLEQLRDHPEWITQTGDMTWFNLAEVDIDKPVLKSMSVNESALTFLERVMNRFSKENTKCKSAADALNALCRLVWERVDGNILHLAIMVKANMVTSPTDATIPVVLDPNGRHVQFASFKDIIYNRHIGNEAAYQEWMKIVTTPSFYVRPKTDSPFDAFMGYHDQQYPEEYGFKPSAQRDVLDISNTSSFAH